MQVEILTKMSTGIIDAECKDKDEEALTARLNAHKGDWMIFTASRPKLPVIVNIRNGTSIRKKR